MDQTEIVEKFKEAKMQWPLGLPEQILCSLDDNFLVSAMAPRETEQATAVLGFCIPAFFADEAVYAVEAHARSIDSTVPIEEDPSATPAILVVFSDRKGGRSWRLLPYGISDQGALEWLDLGPLNAPELVPIMDILDEVYQMGDRRVEKIPQLFMLQSNGYRVHANKAALEGT